LKIRSELEPPKIAPERDRSPGASDDPEPGASSSCSTAPQLCCAQRNAGLPGNTFGAVAVVFRRI
jgi:hypothetical protein